MKYIVYSLLLCIIGGCFLGAAVSASQGSPASILQPVVGMARDALLRIQQAHLQKIRKEHLWELPRQRPAPDSLRISSGFGRRFHPILKRHQMHLGIDISMPVGTVVRAAGGGWVTKVVDRSRHIGYGRYVTISHDLEHSSLYAHLSRIDVREGQWVEAGDTLGASGNSGYSTGPHLHFEIRHQGRPIDPLAYWDSCRVGKEKIFPPGMQP